jgi:hypothetical protein
VTSPFTSHPELQHLSLPRSKYLVPVFTMHLKAELLQLAEWMGWCPVAAAAAVDRMCMMADGGADSPLAGAPKAFTGQPAFSCAWGMLLSEVRAGDRQLVTHILADQFGMVVGQ